MCGRLAFNLQFGSRAVRWPADWCWRVSSVDAGRPIIQCKGLAQVVRTFGGAAGITLDVSPGSVLSIIGASGSEEEHLPALPELSSSARRRAIS